MKLHLTNRLLVPVLMVCLGLVTAGQISAQTFSTLHSFTNGVGGALPLAGLVASGNTLYGVTQQGGGSGFGIIFRINADGSGFTNLHNFNNAAGANPYPTLILSGNTLYGTTYWGGLGWGTVFAMNTDGSGFTNLHRFIAATGTWPNVTNTQGANPVASLVLSGNTLYGTAGNGGTGGKGTVFAVTTNGTGFTTLHNFPGTVSSTNSDGATPQAGLVLSGNTLYGSAYNGGNVGAGTIFSLNTNGADFTTLHHFDWANDGGYPHGLILAGNRLYGTGNGGGPGGSGVVFALNTNGAGFTNLFSFAAVVGAQFTNHNGASPFAGLLLSGGTLYGTAPGGGVFGKGTLFALSTNGVGFTNLYSFAATSGSPATNSSGGNSRAELILLGNSLFGTANNGGTSGYGTVFNFSLETVSSPQVTIVRSGTNVILTWPTNAVGFVLQSTANLVSPVVWSTNSPAPVVANGQNMVTNPISGTQQFYRLSQ